MHLNPRALDSDPNPDLSQDVQDDMRGVTFIRAMLLSILGLLFMIFICGWLNDCRRQRARRRNARRRSTSTTSTTTIPEEIVDMPELRFPPAVDPVVVLQSVSGHRGYTAAGITLSSVWEGDLEGRVGTPPPPYVAPPGYEEIYYEGTGNLSV
ncbi:hypothetical protein E6O75_ATG03734 [Venturia nashicola]|uniref:Uncharacterized protein n=1 Tax=Venturia nashicola TaxID=86259 RepID=A0A4Z1PJD4_9PEZI|nr:hypothetical protein E6O75_ATG03734 [Venturia nashicola]